MVPPCDSATTQARGFAGALRYMTQVRQVEHSLIQHFLARVRDRNTDSVTFRATVRRLSVLLAYEAT